MELHTLGVRTGYTQADVTEFARALTGWTVKGIGRGPGARLAGTDGDARRVRFRRAACTSRASGRSSGANMAQAGEKPGAGGARHAGDQPGDRASISRPSSRGISPATPRRLRWSRGSRRRSSRPAAILPSLYRVLIDSPECWVAGPVKFKSPWEWTVSTGRALGMKQMLPLAAVGLLNQLGQPTWRPGIARRLRRYRRKLGRARRAGAPGRSGRAVRDARGRGDRCARARAQAFPRRADAGHRTGAGARREPRSGPRAAARVARNAAEVSHVSTAVISSPTAPAPPRWRSRRAWRSPRPRPTAASSSSSSAAPPMGWAPSARSAIPPLPVRAASSRPISDRQEARRHVRAAPGDDLAGGDVRREGSAVRARHRLALSRPLAFRRAERARERRAGRLPGQGRLAQPHARADPVGRGQGDRGVGDGAAGAARAARGQQLCAFRAATGVGRSAPARRGALSGRRPAPRAVERGDEHAHADQRPDRRQRQERGRDRRARRASCSRPPMARGSR